MSSEEDETQVGLLSTVDAVDEEVELGDDVQPKTETSTNEPQISAEDEAERLDGDLEAKAGMITQIMVPVCITMVMVIIIVKSISSQRQDTISSAMVYVENTKDDSTTRFLGSLLNAAIFVAMIIVVTVVFVILYKYRCLRIIYGWLLLSTGIMLAGFGGYLFYEMLQAINVPMDWITFGVILWNFAVVGNISIFWHAPIKVNQGYLICISVILAVVFTRLPEWTTWTILAAIAIYDLFAVLCPHGPLRVLVELAQERDEPIPALLYSSSVFMMMASTSGSDDEGETGGTNGGANRGGDDQNNAEEEGDNIVNLDTNGNIQQEEEDDRPKSSGVKLGLGDFVFYSVLVGRAALFDMLTVFASFIGIVTGLFATILLLALFRKALPALPISIGLGILFFFAAKIFLFPFVNTLLIMGIVL